jgi:hypothetical protein
MKKKRARLTGLWTVAGACALALGVGMTAKRTAPAAAAAASSPAISEDLHDAVAAPVAPPTAALAGRPVPTSWFKAPSQRKAEMDSALMSSRRRRLARRVAVQ